MCTLVVAAKVIAGYPLVVIANRDEQKDRASSPPMRWPAGFIAPRDEVAGGTWLGLNDHGVFVGITNRYLGPRDASRISRGALVTSALERSSAREIHAAMATVDPGRYNGFHLVYADEREVLATISDGRELAQLVLGDGLSIVTERSFNAGDRSDDDRPRVARIRAAWSRVQQAGGRFDPTRLTTLPAEHDQENRLAATCIHLDELSYGTRSSMVLALAERASFAPAAARLPAAEQRVSEMLWAEGPPCTTPFYRVPLGDVSAAGKTG